MKQGVPPGEVKGFSLYLSTLSRVTHSHHLSEDDIVFPYFKDLLDAPYDRLKDDHNDMARILEALDQSILELSSGGIDRLRVVLDEFAKLWGPLALPFLFYNLEGKDREDFMKPIPWIVKKVFVPVIWRNQWKPMRPFLH